VKHGLTVVKLGGSHALSPLLRPWLDAIGRAGGDVVVVPGGGPFADAVRVAQPVMGFDDDAAHDMAMMAMAQYGRALVGLTDGLVYADTLEAVRDAVARSAIAVWSPWPGLQAHADIPRSWDVTSDSLAVWLAGALNARRVVLIKHRAPVPGADDDLVDVAFPQFTSRFRGDVIVVGPDALASADALFGARSAVGG
jgi:5-(aminomethyl)-3-furanmethanol phosphate kinase